MQTPTRWMFKALAPSCFLWNICPFWLPPPTHPPTHPVHALSPTEINWATTLVQCACLEHCRHILKVWECVHVYVCVSMCVHVYVGGGALLEYNPGPRACRSSTTEPHTTFHEHACPYKRNTHMEKGVDIFKVSCEEC